MSEGFVDLRQNQGQMVEDSFWPSFTDIMTVVVMIFLIASSILIVKNWELVNELQSRIKAEQKISQRLKASIAAQEKTSEELLLSQDKRSEISRKLQLSIEAERRTSEAIKKTSKEKASLEEMLTQAQSELSLTRLQLMQAGESAEARDRLIAEQDKQLTQLSRQQSKLNQQIAARDKHITQVQQKIAAFELTMSSLQGKLKFNTKTLAQTEQQLKEKLLILTGKEAKLKQLSEQNKILLANISNYKNQVAAIEQKNVLLTQEFEQQQLVLADKDAALANKDEALALLNQQNQVYLDNINNYKEQIALAEQQHSGLADEYKTLEEKYNKLVRPSRSAVGKYVAEVRYEKLSGKETIQFRTADKEQYETLSKAKLHKKLLILKRQYKNSLYVKIIIPDNSGLSYNEAWTFMMDLLNKYDYYYQN